ncbi:uncharacterized protein LOC117171199 [Belonocnema kinseyi]|uniref:uncharacterized protein LOC117171199 n=1 Tax=Belonocnema kinseyi TaxID=2817044 RepID=UPI00143DC7E8|nr:uncharacterized protein LOC117171199 [Belonocnema kinseyi]
MSLTRLGFLSRNVFNFSQRLTIHTIKRNQSSKPIKLQEEIDLDKPVEYSKTEAAKWLAKHTREPEENKPPYQTYVISGSLAVFMVYFCILREENDLDLLIDRPLDEVLKNLNKSK